MSRDRLENIENKIIDLPTNISFLFHFNVILFRMWKMVFMPNSDESERRQPIFFLSFIIFLFVL